MFLHFQPAVNQHLSCVRITGAADADDGVPSNFQQAGSRSSAEGKRKRRKGQCVLGANCCSSHDKKLGKSASDITGLNNVVQVTQ